MENFDLIISLGTVASHVAIIFIVFVYLAKKEQKIFKFIGKYGVNLAFLIALSGMLISLYYSDIIGLEPCTLCWYQRIFLYPIVFILGLGIFKRDFSSITYSIFLSVIGAVLAIYHTLLQFGVSKADTCSIYSTVSCSNAYIKNFGYVTIPVMSLTGFVLIILLLLLTQKYGKQ